MNTIPLSFEEWKKCIENDCKIPISKEFATQRLNAMLNKKSGQTITFIEKYGEQHYSNIISWLKRAIDESE